MKLHRLSPRKLVKAWVRQQEAWAGSGISLRRAELFSVEEYMLVMWSAQPSIDQYPPKLRK